MHCWPVRHNYYYGISPRSACSSYLSHSPSVHTVTHPCRLAFEPFQPAFAAEKTRLRDPKCPAASDKDEDRVAPDVSNATPIASHYNSGRATTRPRFATLSTCWRSDSCHPETVSNPCAQPQCRPLIQRMVRQLLTLAHIQVLCSYNNHELP